MVGIWTRPAGLRHAAMSLWLHRIPNLATVHNLPYPHIHMAAKGGSVLAGPRSLASEFPCTNRTMGAVRRLW
jgi:hypothetical protein